MRTPRKGDRYRSLRPFPIIAVTTCAAPCTGGENGTFPADETFIVLSDPNEGATAVSCHTVHYEQLHAHFVPETERTNALYCGYYLCIDIEWIMTRASALELAR
jgi:hypothetical protein